MPIGTSTSARGWVIPSIHHDQVVELAADGRAHHLALAKGALAAEPDAGDRQVIADQLATVPEF